MQLVFNRSSKESSGAILSNISHPNGSTCMSCTMINATQIASGDNCADPFTKLLLPVVHTNRLNLELRYQRWKFMCDYYGRYVPKIYSKFSTVSDWWIALASFEIFFLVSLFWEFCPCLNVQKLKLSCCKLDTCDWTTSNTKKILLCPYPPRTRIIEIKPIFSTMRLIIPPCLPEYFIFHQNSIPKLVLNTRAYTY